MHTRSVQWRGMDVSNGVIRAVGDGVFQEDAIRLLRAVRLSATLGFDIEEETLSLIQRDAKLLDKVSGERVRDEFLGHTGIRRGGGARTPTWTSWGCFAASFQSLRKAVE